MPGELEEATLVEGATRMKDFWQVLMPLTQEYDARTVQVAIAQFAGNQQFELPFAKRMAAAVVVTLPLILLELIFQRKIIAGLTAGAVKG